MFVFTAVCFIQGRLEQELYQLEHGLPDMSEVFGLLLHSSGLTVYCASCNNLVFSLFPVPCLNNGCSRLVWCLMQLLEGLCFTFGYVSQVDRKSRMEAVKVQIAVEKLKEAKVKKVCF